LSGTGDRVLLRKEEMLLLDACKGHLTPDVKLVIHAMNNDLDVIPEEMTSQLRFWML
jgi:hypothetical protein